MHTHVHKASMHRFIVTQGGVGENLKIPAISVSMETGREILTRIEASNNDLVVDSLLHQATSPPNGHPPAVVPHSRTPMSIHMLTRLHINVPTHMGAHMSRHMSKHRLDRGRRSRLHQ